MKNSKKKKLEELVEIYQQTSGDEIIGALYKELEQLTYKISSAYWGLTTEDISSFSFETVYNCLRSFKLDGGSKFTSYYSTSLKFRLRAETTALNQQKRKANLQENTSSYEELEENGFAIVFEPEQEILLLDAIERLKSLTPSERMYCQYLIFGKYNNEEIAAIMGVSVMTLCYMRKRLQPKLKEVFIKQ